MNNWITDEMEAAACRVGGTVGAIGIAALLFIVGWW